MLSSRVLATPLIVGSLTLEDKGGSSGGNRSRTDLVMNLTICNCTIPRQIQYIMCIRCREENRAAFWKVISNHPEVFTNKYSVAYDGAFQMYIPSHREISDMGTTVMIALLTLRSVDFPQCIQTFQPLCYKFMPGIILL